MHLSEQWQHDVRRQIHGVVDGDPPSGAGRRKKPCATTGRISFDIGPVVVVAIAVEIVLRRELRVLLVLLLLPLLLLLLLLLLSPPLYRLAHTP